MPVFSSDYLKKISVRLFEKVGVQNNIAQIVSNSIIENCLYGHDTHGMILVLRFIKDVQSGKIKPDSRTEVVKKSACIASINGHMGFGQVTMRS